VATENAVDVPICAAVHAIVQGSTTLDDAIEGLLSRPFRAES